VRSLLSSATWFCDAAYQSTHWDSGAKFGADSVHKMSPETKLGCSII
jgi:hypothetical protein